MSKIEAPKAGQSLLGLFYDHWIIYDHEVKGKLCEWGVECDEEIKLVHIDIWTQFLKQKLKVIEISRADFFLKQLQEENFNVKEMHLCL